MLFSSSGNAILKAPLIQFFNNCAAYFYCHGTKLYNQASFTYVLVRKPYCVASCFAKKLQLKNNKMTIFLGQFHVISLLLMAQIKNKKCDPDNAQRQGWRMQKSPGELFICGKGL